MKTMRYHFIPIRMAIIKKSKDKCWKKCGEKGPLYTDGGNVNQYSIMENNKEFPQKIKTELLYDLEILPLFICEKEMKSVSQRDMCTFMSVAALFTIVKIRR